MGKPPGCKIGELARIVGRKEDVVVGKRKAPRLGVKAEGEGRERAGTARDGADGRADIRAEKTFGERGRIAVEDDMGGLEALAAAEPHAADPAAGGLDRSDGRAVAEGDAVAPRERLDGGRKRRHAAVDDPDAGRLDMGDKHEGGGRPPGIAAGVGGVTAEELHEARVAEVAGKRPHEGGIGPEGEEITEPACPQPKRQAERRRLLPAQEAPVERAVDAPGLGHEGAEGPCLGGAREAAHGVCRLVEIGEEVEAAAIGPGVPRKEGCGREPDGRLEAAAGVLEELVEDVAQGEDGRAGVDSDRRGAQAAGESADLAARRIGRLDDGDGKPARGKGHGSGEAADSGPDDDDGLALRACHGGPLTLST